MPLFIYEALTADGRRVSGDIEAADRRAALGRLSEDGLIPIDARPGAPNRTAVASTGAGASGARAAPSSSFGRGLSRAVTEFARELATLTQAGQPVEGALRLLAETSEKKRLRQILARVLERVRAGLALSDALAEHGQAFDPPFVAMVRAGEASGRLAPVLADLAAAREKSEALQRKLGSAMIYPFLLIATALGSIVILLTVVVPRFAGLFDSIEGDLPAGTAFVMGISDTLTGVGTIPFLIIAVLVLVLIRALRTGAMLEITDRLVFSLPLFGSLARERASAEIARGLGMMLGGGVDLAQAMRHLQNMVTNRHVAAVIGRASAEVRAGRRLSASLASADILTPAASRLLAVGEESGQLGSVALHVADAFDERVASRLARLVALIEPATIIVMGLIVGGIVLSILGAVMSVYEVAG